jgi:transposase
MGHPLVLRLSTDQEVELLRLRDHAPKPYLRERAAALLKVAAGMSAKQVAAAGLLRVRRAETVAGWVYAFREGGVEHLGVRPGRGRKPAFSPSTHHDRGRRRRGP